MAGTKRRRLYALREKGGIRARSGKITGYMKSG
jgi:hypothetical protein